MNTDAYSTWRWARLETLLTETRGCGYQNLARAVLMVAGTLYLGFINLFVMLMQPHGQPA